MSTLTRHRSNWLVGAVLVAAVAAAGIVVGALADGDEGDTVHASELAAVQRGCEQWTSARPGDPPLDCSQMTDWMRQRMSGAGMGPMMMFGSPDTMRATCRQWMAQHPPTSATDPQASCDAMVRWMDDHVGDWSGRDGWNDWAMNGPMMGG